MQRVYRLCAGLDVHKKSVTVCIRVSRNRSVELVKRVFGTYPDELDELGRWLKAHKVLRLTWRVGLVFARVIQKAQANEAPPEPAKGIATCAGF